MEFSRHKMIKKSRSILDLDIWDSFGRENVHLVTEEYGTIYYRVESTISFTSNREGSDIDLNSSHVL